MPTDPSAPHPASTPSPHVQFGAELRRLRLARELSQKTLANQLGYTPSYISKIESGDQPPTRTFAERADEILQSAGHLMGLWRDHDAQRAGHSTRPLKRGSDAASQARGLVVQHEIARLELIDGVYRTRVIRHLRNDGEDPITRYIVRVAVDRHPDASQRSNQFYRQRPLTIGELSLAARCDNEPMAWKVEHDRDSFKEIALLFENDRGRFPLYHGRTAVLDYEYGVSGDKWGKWWQRAIRLPTEQLSIELALPSAYEPMVWGLETSLSAERVPVRPGIHHDDDRAMRIYRWSTRNPHLHSRYRFEWRFNNENELHDLHLAPSERMRRLGIVQRGDPVLSKSCVPFDLPLEADTARALGDRLSSQLMPLQSVHNFGKGIGLAAPQIGVTRAAAVVALPNREPLVLYNPTVISFSVETDLQFEGCLSFFDVRGLVERPLKIEVEHQTLSGKSRILEFDHAAARHWCHEIDHLNGVLYCDRLTPGTELVPVERYNDIGQRWSYQDG